MKTQLPEVPHNYLPGQYADTNGLAINHNYLRQQFSDYRAIFDQFEKLVQNADYTLGKSVDEFEDRICKLTGSPYAIGVGSGTDALSLSLKAAGIGPCDEVITTPYTFFATVGAIVTTGAMPVFADIGEDYNIDPEQIEKAVTARTKAILPVHWAGLPCRMDAIMEIAERRNLVVVEDACHAICANYKGKAAGTFGLTGCFSMHPLKNLNVWGDGGFVLTASREMHDKLALLRNHGLLNRNECAIWAGNSRLDSLQAIVANHLLEKIESITESRIANAARYDRQLSGIPQLKIPNRPEDTRQVYHLYVIRAESRDALQQFLINRGIDAKVHYPIPMHLQKAAVTFGYRRGDFPVCEAICDSVLSLPVHEFITDEQIDYVAAQIEEFYAGS